MEVDFLNHITLESLMIRRVGNEQEKPCVNTGKSLFGMGNQICAKCGKKYGGAPGNCQCPTEQYDNPYNGWGTALKPAHEPIVLARKPFKGTVVDNVIKHGTGGINIDKSRVEYNGEKPGVWNGRTVDNNDDTFLGKMSTGREEQNPEGRWPANFIHDGSDEVVEQFPDTKGRVGAKMLDNSGFSFTAGSEYKDYRPDDGGIKDDGSAARFFYCAKVSKSERGEGNNHPTVKPVKLMSYLVNLITPVNGIVLDPFMGSGSTGMACKQEGFNFIGIDLDEEYVNIAKARID